MAARFWRWVLGFDVAFAVALAALLARRAHPSTGMALILAIGLLLCIHALCVAGSFVLSIILAHEANRGARASRLPRAFLIECVLFGKAMLDMSTAPWRRSLEIDRPASGRMRPVLLIHGILCNGAVWRPWFERLRAAGFAPVKAIDLEPLFGTIDAYAAQVVSELSEMQRQCGGARIAIIAHSLGGLVARAALRAAGPSVISEIVTIASPHRGVAMASRCPWPPLRQLSPDSPWLRALKAAEVTSRVPFTCIYSLEDNLVPAHSAGIDGARVQELKGLGHVSLLGARRSIDCALAALSHG